MPSEHYSFKHDLCQTFPVTMEILLATDPEIFVLRLWVEARELPTEVPILRGRVEQVSSSRRRYIKDYDELQDFIGQCLDRVGFPVSDFDRGSVDG